MAIENETLLAIENETLLAIENETPPRRERSDWSRAFRRDLIGVWVAEILAGRAVRVDSGFMVISPGVRLASGEWGIGCVRADGGVRRDPGEIAQAIGC